MNVIRNIIIVISVVFAIVLVATTLASTPPLDFSGDIVVNVESGDTLSIVSQKFADAGIIRSQFLFKAFVVLLGDSDKVLKGDYLFDQPQSVVRVAYRIAAGLQGLSKIKVTIPEGSNTKNIAVILKKAIPSFDGVNFLLSAHNLEGQLFPDTYFFFEDVTSDDVIKVMRANFDAHVTTINDKVIAFGKPFKDILTMASIVEKEATSSVDRRIIAGVLWKRLADGMPLQVDPPFFYFLNKTSEELTLDDLAVDSPYNLYKNAGLPPTPIDNPGLEAILDTVTPTQTKYWYYLSDKTGAMHYATTFDGHLVNKEKYLQ